MSQILAFLPHVVEVDVIQLFRLDGLEWFDDSSEMGEVGRDNGGASVECLDARGEIGGYSEGFERGDREIFERGDGCEFRLVYEAVVPGKVLLAPSELAGVWS